jgi:hypothetical protein
MNRASSSSVYNPVTSKVISHSAFSSAIVTNPIRHWRQGVIDCLNELVSLERGWDGYRAGPVSFENAYFALNMLDSICSNQAPAPQIVPGSSSDLQVEWHTELADIELHVRGPNDVHAWRSTSSTSPSGEELKLSNDFTVVARWIAEMSEQTIADKSAAA